MGAKSGALSSVLVVAGAVATVSASNAVTPVTVTASVTPTATVTARPAPTPTATPAPTPKPHEAAEPSVAPIEPAAPASDGPCAGDVHTRTDARTAVQDAFARLLAGLEQLRRGGRGDVIERAAAMLRELAQTAGRAIEEMPACADAPPIAQKAIDAMETVFNLAKKAALATPTPKPTPPSRQAEKPHGKEMEHRH